MRLLRSSPPPPRGLLERRWLTYLLMVLVIILIVAFFVSMHYQDEIVQFIKDLLGVTDNPAPPSFVLFLQSLSSSPITISIT